MLHDRYMVVGNEADFGFLDGHFMSFHTINYNNSIVLISIIIHIIFAIKLAPFWKRQSTGCTVPRKSSFPSWLPSKN